MKKSITIIAFAFALVVWQGCGSKSNETNMDTPAEGVSAETSVDAQAEGKKEIALAKRDKIEKAKEEKAEQRRQAAIEKAKASLSYKDASGRIVYNKAEIDPSYTGGNKAMKKYLKDNIKYPQVAQDNGIEGTVFVDFVVDEKGNVTDVTAADFIGDDDQTLKEESMRVVKSMPEWVAGKQHGKTVSSAFSIPITFQLN